MEYRTLPHGGEKISILGFGTGRTNAEGEREKEVEATVTMALENGINIFDLSTSDSSPFPVVGRAVGSSRKNVYYQMHFGADFRSGKYGWTTDLEAVKGSMDWQLDAIGTDYIDFGFIHCIDEEADLDKVENNGVVAYIEQLKKQGVVRHIALSTHTPSIANRILDTGIVDMLMFSINPAYDYMEAKKLDFSEDARICGVGSNEERMALYRKCVACGVGISVMKPLGGGKLLNDKTSVFGKALTKNQCIQYALDKPGVVTVLSTIRDRDDLRQFLGYLDATPEEKDYSILGSLTPQNADGVCVYCNHCQPCPAGLDVALINKYYDLALAGDEMAANHYQNLGKTAKDCVGCGHCDRRCPFHVKQSKRMQEIQNYFGK